jgi:hypothetical protein
LDLRGSFRRSLEHKYENNGVEAKPLQVVSEGDRILEEYPDDNFDTDELDLNNSKLLDVHRWSNYPEVNDFVGEIYDLHFSNGWYAKIAKKHLKVVLLDLYIAWTKDPDLKTSYSRNVDSYKPKSRYNELHISKKTIDVIDQLERVKLIKCRKGFYDRRVGKGRVSRMWATPSLIEYFQNASFTPNHIVGDVNRESIILRSTLPNSRRSVDVEYKDSDQTNTMRNFLASYNDLLDRTFIDIPSMDKNHFLSESGAKLFISQNDKFVRRIFNRGSFEMGGRFWGGWWQRCPKHWRSHIFLNDRPTCEADYRGMHIVLLYALAGVDYWTTSDSDPYVVETPEFLKDDVETRLAAKRLVLMMINASSEKAAFSAFRNEAAPGSAFKHLTDTQLGFLLEQLRKKHPKIEAHFGSDAGVHLMNKDAEIAERVLKAFVSDDIPILAIHDSFIVPETSGDRLVSVMQSAFRDVAHISDVQIKKDDGTSCLNDNEGGPASAKIKVLRSKRYMREFEDFQKRKPDNVENVPLTAWSSVPSDCVLSVQASSIARFRGQPVNRKS